MQPPNLTDHARHDAILIAGHAAGDLTETDRVRADALLTDCQACADLRRDLVAIAAATRSVPAPATLARDLRLSPEQADRLRRGSWLRGFLRPFGAAGSPFRPMAAAFTSLGVVGLVVGISLSNGLSAAGGFFAGPAQERTNAQAPGPVAGGAGTRGAEASLSAEAQNGGAFDSYAPMAQSSGDVVAVQGSSVPREAATDDRFSTSGPTKLAYDAGAGVGSNADGEDGDSGAAAPLASPQAPSPLIAGSLALLGIGLLLFGLRIASRRLG